MNPEGQRYRLFEAVAALLAQASGVRPVMLVFDDLHWADKPTLLMLRHVMRASIAASLCIVGTYRESELARTHPLAEMLADLRRQPSVTRLSLRGLEQDQVKVLVNTFVGRDVVAVPRAPRGGQHRGQSVLHRRNAPTSDGNRRARHACTTGPDGRKSATALGLPEGVKEVIGRRLSRLSEACNRTLSLAAVIGREFDIEILEALGDLPEDRLLDAIDEGVRAQLISEAPYRAGRFSFVHALIRETLYGELTTTRRVRLHRRVGEAIERLAQGRSDQPLADLAYHFVQAASADVADKAIDYATRAGDRAADALAHEEAARLYDMALQSLDLKPASAEADVRRADLHTRRARAFGALAQWAAQKPDLEQALRHLDPQQIERRAELLVELAAASFWLLDLPAVERLAPEALDLAERVHRSDLAANAIAWLAHARSGHGDLPAAIEMGSAAIARAGGAQDDRACDAPALSLPRRARDRWNRVRCPGDRDGAGVAGYDVYHVCPVAPCAESRQRGTIYRGGRRSSTRSGNSAAEYGVLPLLARATAMAAGFHLSVFDFEGGVALASEARELGRSAGFLPSVVSAGIDLLLTFARRHDPGRAEGLLPETAAAAVGATGSHRWLWELRLTQVRAELALGAWRVRHRRRRGQRRHQPEPHHRATQVPSARTHHQGATPCTASVARATRSPTPGKESSWRASRPIPRCCWWRSTQYSPSMATTRRWPKRGRSTFASHLPCPMRQSGSASSSRTSSNAYGASDGWPLEFLRRAAGMNGAG